MYTGDVYGRFLYRVGADLEERYLQNDVLVHEAQQLGLELGLGFRAHAEFRANSSQKTGKPAGIAL